MEITKVDLFKVTKEDSRVKGVCNILLDDQLAIHDIRIVETVNGKIVAMPNKKVEDKFRDIVHPITKELRAKITDAVLKEYNNC